MTDKKKLTHNTGEDAITVGEPYTDQEDAAESTKDVKSVKQVADPTNNGGLPKLPKDQADTGPDQGVDMNGNKR